MKEFRKFRLHFSHDILNFPLNCFKAFQVKKCVQNKLKISPCGKILCEVYSNYFGRPFSESRRPQIDDCPPGTAQHSWAVFCDLPPFHLPHSPPPPSPLLLPLPLAIAFSLCRWNFCVFQNRFLHEIQTFLLSIELSKLWIYSRYILGMHISSCSTILIKIVELKLLF